MYHQIQEQLSKLDPLIWSSTEAVAEVGGAHPWGQLK